MGRLPAELEHACHEYLPIEVVCALQCVSRAWRTRIGGAVRERFRWEIRHLDGVDAPVEDWLVGVCDARVNVRTLHLVRTLLLLCAQFNHQPLSLRIYAPAYVLPLAHCTWYNKI